MQMKKGMKLCSRILSGTMFLLLLSVAAISQNIITGKVTDSKDGSPAVGVTVAVKGTKIATKTNADGSYKLNAPSANPTLIFSSTEFGRKETLASNASSISLIKSVQDLGGVVVIGYGKVNKKDVTGSLTTVTSKDFNQGPSI